MASHGYLTPGAISFVGLFSPATVTVEGLGSGANGAAGSVAGGNGGGSGSFEKRDLTLVGGTTYSGFVSAANSGTATSFDGAGGDRLEAASGNSNAGGAANGTGGTNVVQHDGKDGGDGDTGGELEGGAGALAASVAGDGTVGGDATATDPGVAPSGAGNGGAQGQPGDPGSDYGSGGGGGSDGFLGGAGVKGYINITWTMPTPTITTSGYSHRCSPTTGGGTFTLPGTGFAGGGLTTVKIGVTNCTITVVSATEILVTFPPKAAGVYDVTVTNTDPDAVDTTTVTDAGAVEYYAAAASVFAVENITNYVDRGRGGVAAY